MTTSLQVTKSGFAAALPDGMRAFMPAGATWDWTIDETTEMTALSDTISLATWDLASGLTPGVVVTTSVKSTIFITAPATPSDTPYRCTLTYTTAGGRVTLKAFWLYAVDPIRFSA